MKCHIVLDKKGKIVSVSYMGLPKLEAKEGELPKFAPVPEPDQTVVELDVSDQYVELPPADLIERLQDDIQTKQKKMEPKK